MLIFVEQLCSKLVVTAWSACLEDTTCSFWEQALSNASVVVELFFELCKLVLILWTRFKYCTIGSVLINVFIRYVRTLQIGFCLRSSTLSYSYACQYTHSKMLRCIVWNRSAKPFAYFSLSTLVKFCYLCVCSFIHVLANITYTYSKEDCSHRDLDRAHSPN